MLRAGRSLLGLAPGDVLRLNHHLDRPVELSVGGLVKFYGELTAHNGRTAARITALNQR